VLGNHDKPRIASRVGAARARIAALLLLTLRGTPTIYYGDEIGMPDGDIPRDRIQDPQALNLDDPSFSRDPVRTPMRWDGTELGGFTTGEPWLPVGNDAGCSVDAQRDDPDSMLSLHRHLLAVRRREVALQLGEYAPFCIDGDAFAFTREHDGRRLLVAVNLGDSETTLQPGEPVRGTVIAGTHRDRESQQIDGSIELRGNEGVLVEMH
jgi:alpha-glucosidase